MPYSRFNKEEMILRDHLARDRTILANERTLLAYVRTAIALLAAGGTLVRFFPDSIALHTTGIALLALGVCVVGFGIWRFIDVARDMRKIGHAGAPPHAPAARARTHGENP